MVSNTYLVHMVPYGFSTCLIKGVNIKFHQNFMKSYSGLHHQPKMYTKCTRLVETQISSKPSLAFIASNYLRVIDENL